MPQTIEFEGTTHEFPDDFSPEDISSALKSHAPKVVAQSSELTPLGSTEMTSSDKAQLLDAGIDPTTNEQRIAQMKEEAMKPAFPIPHIERSSRLDENQPEPALERAARIGVNTLTGAANFAQSLAGVGLAEGAALSPVIGTVAATGFAVQGLSDLPDVVREFIAAKTPAQKDAAIEKGIMDLAMGAGGAVHAAGGRTPMSEAERTAISPNLAGKEDLVRPDTYVSDSGHPLRDGDMAIGQSPTGGIVYRAQHPESIRMLADERAKADADAQAHRDALLRDAGLPLTAEAVKEAPPASEPAPENVAAPQPPSETPGVPAGEGAAEPLAISVLNKLESDNYTMRDAALEIASSKDAPKKLLDAANAVLEARKEDRDVYGDRGGLTEVSEDALSNELNAHSNRDAGNKDVAEPISDTPIDVSLITNSKTEGDMFSNGGAMLSNTNNSEHLKQIQTAMKAWKAPILTPATDAAAKASVPVLREGQTQGDLLGGSEDLTLVGERVKSEQAKPADTLHSAPEVTVTTPKGATMIRVTDAKGRESVEPLKNVNKGSNPFKDAGPFKKVEAGTIDAKKKFVPMEGDVSVKEKSNAWTSATEDAPPDVSESPKGMKRSARGGEAGAINIPQFSDRKMSQLDEATTSRSAKLQKSFDEATRAQKEIRKAIPSEKRQEAVSVWMEANGDAATLTGWEAGAKGDVFRRAAKDAQTLTPEEISIAQRAQKAFEVLAARGAKYDVLKSGRDNYVPHVWDVEKSKVGFGGAKLQQNFKFAKARTFDTIADGDAAGFKPKTLAIGKLLPAYLHEMNKVIADRQFVQDLATRTAKDGRPLVIPRGRVSEIETTPGEKAYLANPRAQKGMKDAAGNDIEQGDYRTMENQPALHDWRWEGKDSDGNPIYMKDDLSVHPEAAKRLTAMLGKSAIREWYNEPSEGGARIPKAIAKGLDTAQAVMKREMFGLLAPFHQVQEGWHGIAHKVNPIGFTEGGAVHTAAGKILPKSVMLAVDPLFNMPKIDLRDAAQMDAAKHGLMLLPDRASAQNYMEGVGAKGTFLTQVARAFGESKAGEKLGGKAATAVADVIDGYQNYLFHQYIPGLKFKTYEAIRERNAKLYAKDVAAGKLSESDVKLLSAEQTNAAYGHLNYALLDRNPTMQHLLQLSLLAPDFLEARTRFTGQAVKGLLGSKVGTEQFRAIATIAAVQAAIAYTATTLGGDEWDAKHPFEAVHKGRRYTLRSVPEDIASLLSDSRQFIYGRINPLTVKGATQLVTGVNYRGEKTTALETMEELLAQYIPITARSVPALRKLTETSRQSPISPLEQLAGSIGVRISRKSPITDTFRLAGDWMEKQGVPKDKGSYPVSKYQQLRYALEDGDLSRAGEEFDKLKKTSSAEKIASGFHESINHSFTQSRAMDEKFRASLSKKDLAVYDLAQRRRVDISNRFRLLPTKGK